MTIEVKDVMTAFEEFKTTNDQRLKEIEKRGSADPVLEAKLIKIEADLARGEDLNQKITVAAAAAKKAEDEVKTLRDTVERVEAKAGRPGAGGTDKDAAETKAKALDGAFDTWLRKGEGALSSDESKALNEHKTLYGGNDTQGGFFLAPPTLSTDIIKQIVLQSDIRSIARVTAIGTQSYKFTRRTGTFAALRVGEVAQRNETTGYSLGQGEIFAPEIYAEVHLSTQMIEDQFFDVEAEMALEFAEQFAVAEGAEFVNGSGTGNKAEGFMTNASVGFVASGGTTTIADANGQADGLIDAFYKGLKTAYARNATWVMNRQTIGSVRKLKDAQKQYIWQPGVAGNVPNTILGAPYLEVPDMPNEGANTYPIAVGDFYKAYRIVDRVMVSVLRDPYTLSAVGQVLYRARKRFGGAVVLPEAIVKVKCA